MNKNELFGAIGALPDDLVNESERSPRRLHIKKIGVAAALIAAIVSATALAATLATRHSTEGHSYKIDYKSVPSRETLVRDVGMDVEIPKELSAFAFKNGSIVHESDLAEDGSKLKEYKSLSFLYESENESLDLNVAPADEYPPDGDYAGSYNGIDFYYTYYVNKFVPGDYELTEQDKRDRAEGKYVFSFGSDKVEVTEVKGLHWENGLEYSFISIGGDITKEGLIELAKNVIDMQ